MSNYSTCGSCGAGFSPAQKFCGFCGQPVPTHRIDWQFLSHEVQHGLLHVDKGILFTVKHLLTRPGAFIREYIDGNRAGHFKPVLLVMILGAVLAIITKLTEATTGSVVGTWSEFSSWLRKAGSGEMKFNNPMDKTLLEHFSLAVDWIGGHFALVLVLLVPFFALAMRAAFAWSKRPVNYPEWLVIGCFLTAQALCMLIILKLIGLLLPSIANASLLIILVVQCLTVMRLYRDVPKWNTFARFFGGYAFYSIIFGVVVTIASILVMVWAVGPEAVINQIQK